jgi:cephalosporin hydroxylase
VPEVRSNGRSGALSPAPAATGFGRDLDPLTARRVWPALSAAQPLTNYFDAYASGPGIWKWRHYLPAYEHHFAKFVGTDVTIVEVGVFSGGSLRMWRDYFGPRAQIHGIDVVPECQRYADTRISIWIGDQADPTFWKTFLADGKQIDVVIDDGSHQPADQIATLEALLPHVSPGGVYVREDAVGVRNGVQREDLGREDLGRDLLLAGGLLDLTRSSSGRRSPRRCADVKRGIRRNRG